MVDHAKLLIREQRYAEANFLLEALPESERRLPELICLSGFIKFNQIAQNAPDAESLAAELATRADNNLARYQLSALKLLAGETEEALEYLLEIVRREPGFDNDAARQSMLTIFQTLGPDDDLVKRYRSLLSGVLNAVH